MNRKRGFLVVLLAVFAYLSLQLFLPFVQYVLGAVLLAYVLYPLQRRLAPRTSPTIAALSLVALAVLGVIVPLVALAALVAEDAIAILETVDPEAIRVEDLEATVEEIAGVEADLASAFRDSGQQVGMALFEQSRRWLATFTHALVGLGVTLFLLYYLLKDGASLVAYCKETTPLPADVQEDFYGRLDAVMAAVLIGHVFIAVVQGTIAGLGLIATGIPNAAFWTFVMIVLALVPLVGAFLVWGPAVGYLFLTAELVPAIALLVYCVVVVSLTDDYLRPIVVDRYADLSPAIILLGVLGGIYAFGITGLFFGPVVLGAFVATLDVIDEHYDRLEGDSSGA